MKIVLDTNVLVSGLLSPYGAPAGIVRMVSSGVLRLCYDARIMVEYQDVLARPKFQFDQKNVKDLLVFMEQSGEVVASSRQGVNVVTPQEFLDILRRGAPPR